MTEDRKYRTTTQAKDPLQPDSLVGSFFHGNADRGWQGIVVAEIAPQIYLIELFSWLMGESTEQQLIPLTEMMDWHFYDDASWMDNQYQSTIQYQWDREREQKETAND